MNTTFVAKALRDLANALETPESVTDAPAQPAAPAPEEPTKPRGRGRPPKDPVAAPAAPAAAPEAADPFDSPAPAAPTDTRVYTQDEVRAALTALRAATNQDNALKVLLEAGRVSNLSALDKAQYGAVIAAAQKATPVQTAAGEADPFEQSGGAAAPVEAEAIPTREEVRAVIVAEGKFRAQDTIQKTLMAFGGVAATAEGNKPSLKALPEAKFVEFVAAVKALPKTK